MMCSEPSKTTKQKLSPPQTTPLDNAHSAKAPPPIILTELSFSKSARLDTAKPQFPIRSSDDEDPNVM